MYKYLFSVFVIMCCLVSCSTTKDTNNEVPAQNITVGKVQREVKVGMTSAEVVTALGSPEIVSTDEKGRQVWTYDKVSAESYRSGSQGGISIIFAGIGGSSERSSRSQKTLTIIVKFDKNDRVRDIAYHATKF